MLQQNPSCSLEHLLSLCQISFEQIFATSRRKELLSRLANKAQVFCDESQLAMWDSEWTECADRIRPAASLDSHPGTEPATMEGLRSLVENLRSVSTPAAALPHDVTTVSFRSGGEDSLSDVPKTESTDHAFADRAAVLSSQAHEASAVFPPYQEGPAYPQELGDSAGGAAYEEEPMLNDGGARPVNVNSENQWGQPSAKGEDRKVFVGGLGPDVEEKTLQFVFEQFGKVVKAEVKRDSRTGKSRGFAFVIFATVEAAQAATAASVTVRGHSVKVQPACGSGSTNKSKPSVGSRTPDASHKVFVGGLPQDCEEKELHNFFRACGKVTTAEVKRDPSNGRSRGFGFIVFLTAEAAERAATLERPRIMGKLIEVQRSLALGDPGLNEAARGPDPHCRIFVGGLPQRIGDADLRKYFEEQFGKVDHAEVKRDLSNGRSRGFGFVVFADAASTVAALSHRRLKLGGKAIEIQPTVARGDASLSERTGTAPNVAPYRMRSNDLQQKQEQDQLQQPQPSQGNFSQQGINMQILAKQGELMDLLYDRYRAQTHLLPQHNEQQQQQQHLHSEQPQQSTDQQRAVFLYKQQQPLVQQQPGMPQQEQSMNPEQDSQAQFPVVQFAQAQTFVLVQHPSLALQPQGSIVTQGST